MILEIPVTIWEILSPIFSCLTHAHSEYQTQILLLQSTQFYHQILSGLTHTLSVHKYKYYYYNLHNFFPVIHSNFHYIFPCFYLERIPYLCPCKSHDFIHNNEYKYIIFFPFLTIIYTLVIYIFPYIISVLYIADFIYTMLYMQMPYLFNIDRYSSRRNSWRFFYLFQYFISFNKTQITHNCMYLYTGCRH
jgi:hypothetical protein